RSNADHMQQMKENEIAPIDMVVVNLYPFKETLLTADVTKSDIIENIDIGGPTMLRSAAKNYEDVVVVVDPADYEPILDALNQGEVSQSLRQQLATKVFRHTANYDAMIAEYFAKETGEEFPETYTVT